MAEKRMLIVDAELLRKIDENRGDLSQAEFINLLIDSRLEEGSQSRAPANCVDREEFNQFSQGMKELLRNFLEFFISYGLELGKQPKDGAFEALTKKLQALEGKAQKH